MKRTFLLLFLAALLLNLCSCSQTEFNSPVYQDPVSFYYPRTEYLYGSSDGAITYEIREAAGHRSDPKYLLTLYLQGPRDQSLSSAFPKTIMLTDVTVDGSTMTVTLSSDVALLDELELSIAYTCLAQTCVSIADVDTIIIESRVKDGRLYFSRTITLDQLTSTSS